MKKKHLNSLCVSSEFDPFRQKSHTLPIYPTSAFEFESVEESIEIFTGQKSGYVYSRYKNPTVEHVAENICALECYDLVENGFGLMTSSGMSAIYTLITSIIKQGEEILTQEDLYGGTTELLQKVVTRSGIKMHFADLSDHERLRELLNFHKNIKLIYLETPANPTMKCLDIAEISAIATTFDVLVCVDNTFCTPMIQRPLSRGADFVIHSTTKYLNGHGNSIAGVIVAKDKKWQSVIWNSLKLTGSICSPWEAWLVYNGLKTLSLRMERHSSNALKVAEWLTNHPKVIQVNYNGLKSDAYHDIASKQMSLYGGMLSFRIDSDLQGTLQCINNFRLCTLAPTLGDVDTLVLHPITSSHLNVDRKVCEKLGITDNLIRLSVGIEFVEDIIHDLSQSLDKLK
ncbi:MAG: aminotransferase class I/II-fold pyridoxal phosphate-dependent enzyme [Saprospiraceae bacterium]